MARFKIISALLLLVSSSLVLAQTAPNYGSSNADGTNTIYNTTNNYGPLFNLYDQYYDENAVDNNGITKCGGNNSGVDDNGCWNGSFEAGVAEFGFSFEWHNESFTHGWMATNGCLKLFKSSSSGNSFSGHGEGFPCGDFTPNQLGSGQNGYTKTATDTIFPFYTDLIAGTAASTGTESSAMMFKTFDDYIVFGWYYMQEYGRGNGQGPSGDKSLGSSNSFELFLFDANNSSTKCANDSAGCTDSERAEVDKPDNYGMIYRELSIESHDVLIGEQKDPANYTQYLFYDDETDNGGDGTIDGNFDMMDNGYLEYGGGILYSEASGEPQACQNDPLYSEDCLLYDLAFTEYQCQQDPQSSQQCTFYQDFDTGDGLSCDMDPMSDPSCEGYQQHMDFMNDPNYDPNTGLVTDPSTGMTFSVYGPEDDSWVDYDNGPQFDGGDYDDMGMEHDNYDNYQDDPWMVDGNYDPRLDPNISYDNLNTEQQMLVDQGLSPQDAVFVTMGQEEILALGEDPLAVQFNGHRPGDYVLDAVGGIDNYDVELHDEQMYLQDLEWDPTGTIADNRLTADIWATEEFQQHEDEMMYGMVETYGEEFFTFTDQDWYEHDVITYGQEEVDQWHENIEFNEDGMIEWETFEPTNYDDYDYENELREDEFDMLPDLYEVYDEENEENELYAEEYVEEFERILEEDEAFEELISEEELEELIAEETPQEIREEVVAEELQIARVEEAEEVQEAQEEVREEVAQEEVRVEKEAEQAVQSSSSSNSSSRSTPSYQSVAISQFVAEISDDSQTATAISDVISDGSSSSISYGVDGGSQSFAGQDGSSSSGGSSGSSAGASSAGSGGGTESTGQIAESSSQQQFEQVTGQVDTSIDVASTSTDVGSTSAFEVAEQQQESMQEEQLFIETFDDGSSGISGTDIQFEDNLTEALSSGTGLTEFLSQQAPNFQRFEVQNTMQEQRTTDAVESLADTVGAEVASTNLQAQLDNIQQGEPTEDGGYSDQTIAVAYIGYTAGFSGYTDMTLYGDAKKSQWYNDKQMPDSKIDDNKMGFYRMAGNTQEKLYKMVLMQYGIEPDDSGE